MTSQAFVILGPTASGKSAIALQLAEQLPIEIISMDSALVYREMDIGTAKPTREERSVCPHHLIDVREISDPYSAADFVQDALALVERIRARGRLPVIVGGTMLYYQALAHGLHDMPSSDPLVRERVLALAQEHGWPWVHEQLAQVDPQTAQRLQPNDAQRISRALEVYWQTGETLSAFHARQIAQPIFPYTVLGLLPENRAALHKRIEDRFLAMLEQGFVAEVEHLMSRPDFDRDSPAMRAVGYRQAISYILGEVDYATFVQMGIAATRQLAKRQITWMRGMKDVTLLDPMKPGAFEACLNIARMLLKDLPTDPSLG